MKILSGMRARNFREASRLAFREAGASDMSPEVADLFAQSSHTNELGDETEKGTSSTIRGRYGKSATWDSEQWFIPVPHLRYESRDLPQLVFEVATYVVAAVEVETAEDYYFVTLVEPVGKPEMLVLPLSFLDVEENRNIHEATW